MGVSNRWSPRRLRALRAASRWVEGGGDLSGVDLAVVEQACADAADFLSRDLDIAEVDSVCRKAIATELHDREQQAAAEAIASAREEERLAYLAKVRADLLLTCDDRTPRPTRSPRT